MRFYAYSVSLLVLAATLWPLTNAPHDDGYPLSTYPMFSRPLHSPVSEITRAVAVTSSGAQRSIAPQYVANAEVLQAMVTLRKAVQGGNKPAARLCRAIAERLVQAGALPEAREVQLLTQRIDAVAYVGYGKLAPQHSHLHARCPVPAS